MKKFILVFFVLTIILPLSWFFYHGFEARAPVADLKLSSLYLNSACKIGLTIRDQGTGLRSVRVVIVQDGREKKLLEKHYDARGYQGFFLGSRVFSDTFSIPVEVRKYGMTDGEAVFKINVVDFSWKGWRKGNSVEIKRKVIIDSTPPEIDVLTTRHNVARGGSVIPRDPALKFLLRPGILPAIPQLKVFTTILRKKSSGMTISISRMLFYPGK